MTKRVRFRSDVGVRLNETELAVMKIIGLATRPKPISCMGLTRVLGRSEGTVRSTLRSLKDKGLVTVGRRYLQNGGQAENEYSLTDEGRYVLKSAIEELA